MIYIYKRTNCLLADFSFTDSKTLSRLFNTYCTNIYGSPLWKHFDRKLLEPFYIARRKCIRRVWKIPFTSHNVLLPYIHNTIAFNVILEKRCIKFLWTLFNSGYDICVASLQKGPHVAKIKNEIFVDLNRAGHDKSVEKIISVLAQIFTKL